VSHPDRGSHPAQSASHADGGSHPDRGNRRCEACGSFRMGPLLDPSGDRGAVGRCADCGLVSVLEPPPAADLVGLYNDAAEYARYVAAQRTDALQARHEIVLDRLAGLVGTGTLFDVGAGRGDFLQLARCRGFAVHGNELSAAAAALCGRTYGIELVVGGLEDIPGEARYDAMSMWCVLAHVPDPRRLLADTLRLLRPGGVLYLHTPRWCVLDSAGLAASRLSGGRLSQVSDRRVNTAHLRLFGRRSMTALARTTGFEPVRVAPAAAWSLVTGTYLEQLGVPAPIRRLAAPPLGRLVAAPVGVRNILDVYLRRPLVAGTSCSDAAEAEAEAEAEDEPAERGVGSGARSSSSGTPGSSPVR
jgi:SAM-dependent methyltransferase